MIGTEKTEGPKQFSLVKRAMSFTHAWRGLGLFLRNTHNSWIHVALFVSAIALGIYFGISRLEWIALLIVSGAVFMAEAFNSAIEVDIDLTSPEYHPYARDTKDIAAGAVLITAIAALAVGVFIFGPHLWSI